MTELFWIAITIIVIAATYYLAKYLVWKYDEEDDVTFEWDIIEEEAKNEPLFEIGDRVEVLETEMTKAFNEDLIGKTGTVVLVEGKCVGVSFDKWSSGHGFGGLIDGRSGWWLEDKDLIPTSVPAPIKKPAKKKAVSKKTAKKKAIKKKK